MASSSEQQDLTSHLGSVLQGFIPGLATMDAPARSPSNQEAVIIDMPDDGGPVDADNMNSQEGVIPGGGDGTTSEESDRSVGGVTDGHLRAFKPLLERTLLFVVILLAKILFDHRIGVLLLSGMAGAFFHFNSKIKEQVSQRGRRRLRYLLVMCVLLPLNILLVYFVFADQQLPKCLIFQRPNFDQLDCWTLAWVVGITDFIIKYITMAIKCLVTALPKCCLTFKRRGRVLLCVENISQLYRFLAPINPWIMYLWDDATSHWLFSCLLTLVYILAKSYMITSIFRECLASVKDVFKDVQYGSRPSTDQLHSFGEACPICQDHFTNPVELHCKHIFCDDCVAMWFDREKTCPMCRATVADSPKWRDGSTSASIQWF